MSTIVSTQFLLPQAVIANGAVTGSQWSNPNDILLVDGDVAASNPNQTASDITIGNFLANLPQNAIITGLEFELIAKRGAQTSPVITLTPYLLDNTSGNDVYYPYVTPVTTDLTPDLTTIILGSPTYLFASSFTPDQINNAKLNFIANGDISIDSCLMKVYYYIPNTPSPLPPVGNSCDDCDSPIQAQPFYLALPFKSGDRYAYLQSFNYPDGTPIQYADLGSCGGSVKLVFDPGVPKIKGSNFEENAVTATWTVESNGYVKVDFININSYRGLMFHTPFTADPDLRSNHDANSKVIISDSGPFFGQYLQRCQIDSTISAPIIIENQDVPLADPAHDIDFRGAGVVTQNDLSDSHRKIVTIAGAGGTLPPQVVSVVSATSGNTQVSSLTADINISGLNRGVIIQISTEEAQTITGITVGGVAATQEAISTDVGNNLRQESWFCQNPPLGTQPIVVTMSGAAYITFGAECVNGVDPVSPIGATQSASGSSLNPNLAITTTVDYSVVIDGLGTAQTPILYTPGAGQALNWALTANADTRQGGSSVQNAGTQPDVINMQYAITQNTPWVYTAVEIVGITAAVPGSGQSAIQFDDEAGSPLGAPGTVDEYEMTGPGVVGTRVGNKVIYTISGGGGGAGGTKIGIDATDVTVGNSASVDAYTIPIPANTLGTDNAIHFRIVLSSFAAGADFLVSYGGSSIGTVSLTAAVGGQKAVLEGVLYANGAANSQKSEVAIVTATQDTNTTATQANAIDTKTIGVDSTMIQNLVVHVTTDGTGAATLKGIIVDGISDTATGGQIGIQFDDETGTPLGASGTATEFEITSATPGAVVGSRVGDKIIYAITPGGGGGGGGTKIAVDTTQINIGASTSDAYTIPIPGGILGTNNAIRFKLVNPSAGNTTGAGAGNIQVNVKYGGNNAGTVSPVMNGNSIGGNDIYIMGHILATGATNTQRGCLEIISKDTNSPSITHLADSTQNPNVDSTVAQNLVVTITTLGGDTFTCDGIIVEQISTSSSSDKKKVGVGETDDIQFFNIQYPFLGGTGVTSPTCQWDLNTGGSLESSSVIGLSTNEHFADNATTFNGLLPDFNGTNQVAKFNSGKQVIFQLLLRTVANGTQIGGVGFMEFGQFAIVTGNNLTSNNVTVAFKRDTAGQWYAKCSDNVGHTNTPITISDGKHIFRIEYDPANATPQARFYVDGTLLATVTTTVPSARTEIIGFACGSSNVGHTAVDLASAPSFSVEI